MPSPFPGMDPYIESPRWFPSFHDKFITYLEEELQPNLPAPYFALSGQRVWVEVSGRRVVPGVGVFDSTENSLTNQANGGVAIATAPPAEPVVVKVQEEELHETYLEIYSGEDTGKVSPHSKPSDFHVQATKVFPVSKSRK